LSEDKKVGFASVVLMDLGGVSVTVGDLRKEATERMSIRGRGRG